MDGTYRQSASDLILDLKKNAPKYSFFRAVEILLKETGQKIEEHELRKQGVRDIVFRVDPGLGFPASDIVSIDHIDSSLSECFEMSVNFLGLHGTSSPLPSYLLESASWSKTEEGVQCAFNDFFSHRMIWLLYLIWRKYRYHIRYKAKAQDQFSDWMFSLIGIGEKNSRGHADIPWAKLLTYLGVVAARTRPAQMISGVIAHAFDLKDVSVREFELRMVEIPEDQRVELGKKNFTLNQNFSIGRWTKDIAGKFTIVIKKLSFKRFRDFLPNGSDYERLKELVAFLLKDQLAYDLELHFEKNEEPQFQLGTKAFAYLGWTSFIGGENAQNLKPVKLQVRA